jgi:hypothetical protein
VTFPIANSIRMDNPDFMFPLHRPLQRNLLETKTISTEFLSLDFLCTTRSSSLALQSFSCTTLIIFVIISLHDWKTNSSRKRFLLAPVFWQCCLHSSCCIDIKQISWPSLHPLSGTVSCLPGIHYNK